MKTSKIIFILALVCSSNAFGQAPMGWNGPKSFCAGVGGSYSVSVNPIPGAVRYQWLLYEFDHSSVSTKGSYSNSLNITPQQLTTIAIDVRAYDINNNYIGIGGSQITAIGSSGNISSVTSLGCNGFSCNTISGATSYKWEFIGSSNYTTTTSTNSVDIPNGTLSPGSYTLKVYSINSCGGISAPYQSTVSIVTRGRNCL